MTRRRLKLSNYNLLNERKILKESKILITGATTVSELIALNLIKQSQVDTWNVRAGKKQEKAATQAIKGSNLDIARVAIAYFLVNNYGMIPAGENIHSVRSQKDDKKRKIGFGKKPCEIIVGKVFDAMGIDYNNKVGAAGSAREYTDKVFVELQASGILTNNRSEVSNNAHVRYGKAEDPSLPDSFPKDFPQGDQFPSLKELMDPFLDNPFSFDQGLGVVGDEMETFYISAPDELKFIADQCDPEICSLIDQFASEAIRQDY